MSSKPPTAGHPAGSAPAPAPSPCSPRPCGRWRRPRRPWARPGQQAAQLVAPGGDVKVPPAAQHRVGRDAGLGVGVQVGLQPLAGIAALGRPQSWRRGGSRGPPGSASQIPRSRCSRPPSPTAQPATSTHHHRRDVGKALAHLVQRHRHRRIGREVGPSTMRPSSTVSSTKP